MNTLILISINAFVFLVNLIMLEEIEWKTNEYKKKNKLGRYKMPFIMYILALIGPMFIIIFIWHFKVIYAERRRIMRSRSKKKWRL